MTAQRPPQTGATAAPPGSSEGWSPALRFGFRFAFIYLGFYIAELWVQYWFPSFLQKAIMAAFTWTIHKPATWFGIYVSKVCSEASLDPKNYVPVPHYCWVNEIFWVALLSATFAGIWTLIDRKRPHYRRLHDVFRVLIRYWLASSVWWYAWAKFAAWQFGKGFEAEELVAAFGDQTRFRVMWSTMGVSNTYSVFTAWGEAIACLLLLFRRTTTLGAMLLIPIMLIIAVLDILHEASVGERAVHYTLLAIFLILPDARRILDLYVFNRPVDQIPAEQRFFDWPRHGVFKVVMPALKLLLIVGFFQNPLRFGKNLRGYYMFEPGNHELVGMYNVDEAVRAGFPQTPRFGDSAHWKVVKMSAREFGKGPGLPTSMMVVTWSDTSKTFTVAIDSVKRRLSLTETIVTRVQVKDTAGEKTQKVKGQEKKSAMRDSTVTTQVPHASLTYEWLDRNRLLLAGTVRRDSLSKDSVRMTLRRLPNEASILWGGPGHSLTARSTARH